MDERVEELLIDWVQARERGESPSAEDLCADCPDLLPAFCEKLEELQDTDWLYSSQSVEDTAASASRPAVVGGKLSPDIDLETLIVRLRETELLTEADLRQLEIIDGESDSLSLLERAVESGKLTPFQVEQASSENPLLRLGDYLLLDRIGQGGMGQVFKALHTRMKRIVALKLLPGDAFESREAVVRFEREVEAAARLDHPNIVTAYDAGEDCNRHFLVMQFVEGHDLDLEVKQSSGLPIERALNFVRQAAEGLRFAHENGVVHRDIKPANLLLDESDTVRILDMGLARLDELDDLERESDVLSLTNAGVVMGTAGYMSPEQAEDTRSADHRSDIYSLGCTLFCLLAGQPPFRGKTLVKTILAHRNNPIPAIREHVLDAPTSLQALLNDMLAKSPDDRIGSMAEVMVRIDSVLSEIEAARHLQPKADRPPRSNRRRAVVTLTTGLLITLLAAGLFFKFKTRNGSDRSTPSRPETKVARQDVFQKVFEFGGTIYFSCFGENVTATKLSEVPRAYSYTTFQLQDNRTFGDKQLSQLAMLIKECESFRMAFDLRGTAVTGRGLRTLSNIPICHLSATGLTSSADEVAAAAVDLQAETLHLDSGLTSKGLSEIVKNPHVKGFKVFASILDEQAVDLLAESSITGLQIAGTGRTITEEHLCILEKLTNLRSLGTYNWDISQSQLERLATSLPECRITWNKGETVVELDHTLRARRLRESNEAVVLHLNDVVKLGETVPETYSVELDARRVGPVNALGIRFALNGNPEHSAVAVLGSLSRGYCGLSQLDGAEFYEGNNESRVPGDPFEDGEKHRIRLAVDGNRVSASVDGTVWIDWQGDGDRLSLSDFHAVQRETAFLLRAHTDFEISNLKLSPPDAFPLLESLPVARRITRPPQPADPLLEKLIPPPGAPVNLKDIIAAVRLLGGSISAKDWSAGERVDLRTIQDLPGSPGNIKIEFAEANSFGDAELKVLIGLLQRMRAQKISFHLHDAAVTAAGLEPLQGMTMYVIAISGAAFDADEAARILADENIRVLDLPGLTDAGIAHLAGNPYLQDLTVSTRSVTPDGFRAIAEIGVNRLYVETTDGAMSQPQREALAELQGLQELRFSGNADLSDSQFEWLADRLPLTTIQWPDGEVAPQPKRVRAALGERKFETAGALALAEMGKPPFELHFDLRRAETWGPIAIRVPMGLDGEELAYLSLGHGGQNGLVRRVEEELGGPELMIEGGRLISDPFSDFDAHEVHLLVRHDRLQFSVDGDLLIDWQGDPVDLGIPPRFRGHQEIEKAAVYLYCSNPIEISNLRMTPESAFRDWRNGPQEPLEVQAAQRMRELGARVTTELADGSKRQLTIDDAVSELPLFQVTSIDFFQPFTEATLTEDDLTTLTQLSGLTELRAPRSINDANLAAIAKCRRLNRILLHGDQITVEGLRALESLPTPLSNFHFWDFRSKESEESTAFYEYDFPFLRAEHASSLSLKSLGATRFNDRVLTRFAGSPTLRNLEWYGSPIGEETVRHLGTMPELRRLGLSSCSLTDETAGLLADLLVVEKLLLHDNPLTDAVVSGLSRLNTLQSLLIEQTDISPTGVAHLHAALPGCTILHNDGQEDLDWRTQPQEQNERATAERMLEFGARLHVWHGDTKAIPVDSVEDFEMLEPWRVRAVDFRNVAGAQLTVADCEQLAALPCLKHFRAPRSVNDEMLQVLSQCLSLNQVTLENAQVSPTGLAALANLPSPLQALAVIGGELTDESLRDVSFDELKQLAFERSDLSEAVWKRLSEAGRLQMLEVKSMELSEPAFSAIQRLSDLRHLRLRACGVDDSEVASLTKLSALEQLHLNDNRITDNAISQLAKMKQLAVLSIENNPLTADGLSKLKAALPNCRISEPFAAPNVVMEHAETETTEPSADEGSETDASEILVP